MSDKKYIAVVCPVSTFRRRFIPDWGDLHRGIYRTVGIHDGVLSVPDLNLEYRCVTSFEHLRGFLWVGYATFGNYWVIDNFNAIINELKQRCATLQLAHTIGEKNR